MDLPEEPPKVTEHIAAALLHLLRILVTDPGQPRPEAVVSTDERTAAGSSSPTEVRQTPT
ncbi:hypothetical protein GCM10010508_42010 [Streptomyces naganishii JCM 4654]|uniref:Uncharacterized protein n=1 Tax=Streptomyces naganishii JCM 4654 TaxID=1306179 RepID=A0A919CWD4_9ACTN|nr:hypothetical protein GCM10010508_42010 [Streptomyces naganishii JCM 4654]